MFVFSTQGRVVSIAIVKSDGGVGDWHISVEWTKAVVSISRKYDGNIWVDGGFEGNLDAFKEMKREIIVMYNSVSTKDF